jgi:hypothetical protein
MHKILEEKMKKNFGWILPFFFTILIISCVSTGSVRYRITFDSSIEDPFIQSVWMAYSSHIANDMVRFHGRNPKRDYITPYNTELNARHSLIDFYLQLQSEYEIHDDYIEDLIKIRSSNVFNEYVFFSFNPGNWVKGNNLQEAYYIQWMENNLPDHIPLTLAHVQKLP